MDDLVKGAAASAGSIDMTGFVAWSQQFYQSLGNHNPYVVFSLAMEHVHIWGPLLTLFVFLFFGAGAGAAANGVGNRAAAVGNGVGMGNRAWLAFSAAVTIRQLVLWFFNLPPIRACVRAIGIEIVPAGTRGGAGGRSGVGSGGGGGGGGSRASGRGGGGNNRARGGMNGNGGHAGGGDVMGGGDNGGGMAHPGNARHGLMTFQIITLYRERIPAHHSHLSTTRLKSPNSTVSSPRHQ